MRASSITASGASDEESLTSLPGSWDPFGSLTAPMMRRGRYTCADVIVDVEAVDSRSTSARIPW
jgi:hypothetical protein